MPNFIPRSQRLTQQLSQQLRPNLIINNSIKEMEKILKKLTRFEKKAQRIQISFLSENIDLSFQIFQKAILANVSLNQLYVKSAEWYLCVDLNLFEISQWHRIQRRVCKFQSLILGKINQINTYIQNLISKKMFQEDQQFKCLDNLQKQSQSNKRNKSIQSNQSNQSNQSIQSKQSKQSNQSYINQNIPRRNTRNPKQIKNKTSLENKNKKKTSQNEIKNKNVGPKFIHYIKLTTQTKQKQKPQKKPKLNEQILIGKRQTKVQESLLLSVTQNSEKNEE